MLVDKSVDVKDLKDYEMEKEWLEVALDRSAWRALVKDGARELSQHLDQEEKKKKDQLKSCRERRQESAAGVLRCTFPGCDFTAVTAACLSNHHQQKHQPPNYVQCVDCRKNFLQQGVHNHQKYYCSRLV